MSDKRFKMQAYSGAPIAAGWYGHVIFDISGMRHDDKLPALREHERMRGAGTIDKITKTTTALTAEGVFIDTRDGREVQGLLSAGFPLQASIAVWPETIEELAAGAKATVNGREFVGPGLIWRQSYLREISFVTLGRDANTRAIAASAGGISMNPEETFEARVSEFLKAGMTKGAAVTLAAKRHPDLHAQYLVRLKANYRRPSRFKKPAASNPWLDAVRALQAEGLSFAAATSELERTRPELRQALLSNRR